MTDIQQRRDRVCRSYLFHRLQVAPFTKGEWSYNRYFLPGFDPWQGWKLHITATILSAEYVLRLVGPTLKRQHILFKVSKNLDTLSKLNTGLFGYSQIGKFLTIYCRSSEEAVKLARYLDQAVHGLDGPEVPFDERYKENSSIYYRYGSFASQTNKKFRLLPMLDPLGRRHADKREAGKAVPRWMKDPFKKKTPEPERTNPSKGPLGQNYLVFRGLSQRGKGGVYEALDLSGLDARICILKEGRANGETQWDHSDGRTRLKHEARVLKLLHSQGIPVPKILKYFEQDRHHYLALEKLKGRPFLQKRKMRSSPSSWRWAEQLMPKLENLLNSIHRAGWVWRDCKPSNLIDDRGVLRPMDFEGACRIQDKHVIPWGSPVYSPISLQKTFKRSPGVYEDLYALACILIQLGTGKVPPASLKQKQTLLMTTRCPKPLRRKILKLLTANRLI